MVPLALIPTEWLLTAQSLPRLPAVLVLVICATMLVLGLRAHKIHSAGHSF